MLHNFYEMLHYSHLRATFKYLFLLVAELLDLDVSHPLAGNMIGGFLADTRNDT